MVNINIVCRCIDLDCSKYQSLVYIRLGSSLRTLTIDTYIHYPYGRSNFVHRFSSMVDFCTAVIVMSDDLFPIL